MKRQPHAAAMRRQLGKQPVEKSLAETQPVAPAVERQTGRQHQIQDFRRGRLPGRLRRLPDAERAGRRHSRGIRQPGNQKVRTCRIHHRHEHPLARLKRVGDQRIGLHLVRERQVDQQTRRVPVFRQRLHPAGDPRAQVPHRFGSLPLPEGFKPPPDVLFGFQNAFDQERFHRRIHTPGWRRGSCSVPEG